MTESKMTKILVDLAAKNDYNVFYLIDLWQQDETKRVRETIKLSDLAEEFKKKEGRFYRRYKLGASFKELAKRLEKGEEMQIKCFYRDTYDAYIKKWEEEHPGQKWEEYIEKLKEERKKSNKDFLRSLNTMLSKINNY